MNRLGWIGSFGLAAAAAVALCLDAFSPDFNSARFALVLSGLLLVQVFRFGRVVVFRETVMYACFLGYMLLELLWTGDRVMALNTLMPAANFVLVLVLVGSLAADHDLRAILAGALAGFLVTAAYYTSTSGFPFRYPVDFSYNAVAGMYLFGLILACLLAALSRRRAALLAVAGIIGVHIVATTSIKTNLGILMGAAVAGFAHFAQVSRLVRRNALVIFAIVAVVGVAIATNQLAMERIRGGAERVELGMQILLARENLPGYSAFERRASWQREGYRGLAANPVFGHGVEAFRSHYGLTSHASHVDIAYNSGLIGLVLFYGIFVSLFVRLYRARRGGFMEARLVILATTVAYLLMSFAGTMHYIATLAAFLALGIGILKRA